MMDFCIEQHKIPRSLPKHFAKLRTSWQVGKGNMDNSDIHSASKGKKVKLSLCLTKHHAMKTY
jgi:hypothetical protein